MIKTTGQTMLLRIEKWVCNSGSSIRYLLEKSYSVLKFFAGLASAALVESYIAVNTAVSTIKKADKINGSTNKLAL